MTYDQIILELKKVILKEKGKTYFTFETRVEDMARDCLKFIEENTLTQLDDPSEWIDVETRLPSPYNWVLAAVKYLPEDRYGTPIVAQLQGGIWYSRERDVMPKELLQDIKITHWSPLPKNPEVRK